MFPAYDSLGDHDSALMVVANCGVKRGGPEETVGEQEDGGCISKHKNSYSVEHMLLNSY